MEPIIKLVELLKDLSYKKIAVLVLVFAFCTAVWKIEVIIPYIEAKVFEKRDDSHTPKYGNELVLSSKNLDIAESDIIVIKQYVEKYLEPLQSKLAFTSVYKFIPEGETYLYQGRVLVDLNSKEESISNLVAREMNVSWIPLFSGKAVVEEILDNKIITITYSREEGKFKWIPSKDGSDRNTPIDLVIHSVNLDLLKEVGVEYIVYYPIAKSGKVVGYLTMYFKKSPDLRQVKDISSILSARLLPYLTKETR